MASPRRGDVWRIELEPARGHEQGGARPGLVVSNNVLNHSAADLVVVVPITSKVRPIRSFLRIDPPEGGLKLTSYIICDQVRTVAKQRLVKLLGRVSVPVMREVEQRLRLLLDL